MHKAPGAHSAGGFYILTMPDFMHSNSFSIAQAAPTIQDNIYTNFASYVYVVYQYTRGFFCVIL